MPQFLRSRPIFTPVLLWFGILLIAASTWGESTPSAPAGRLPDVHIEWGGHLRSIAQGSRWDATTLQAAVGPRTALDISAEFRLNNQISIGRDLLLQTHYQAFLVHGDSLETRHELQHLPGLDQLAASQTQIPTDIGRLLDLTRPVHTTDRTTGVHRLDRLNLTLVKPWGTVRLGRQALSWGNGLIFHPMDLFNPFAPTAVLTDYKTGEDMAYLALPLPAATELQIVYVPRREERGGSVHWDRSSLGGKLHLMTKGLEFDLMAADHFQSRILGLGMSGSLTAAAWRIDLVWTEPETGEGYLSAVANLDRSWVWGGKNWYGLVELYSNGLGGNDPAQAVYTPELTSRLGRGELFVLSRSYLAGSLDLEATPLIRLNLSLIANLHDASFVAQPTFRWDPVQNLELIAGASLYAGAQGTEFGGFDLQTPQQTFTLAPANTLFAWLTWYF